MTFPEWLSHRDHDVDRILVAAWLRWQGEYDAAMLVARSIIPPHRADELHPKLAEIVELLGDWAQCYENPRGYALVSEGLDLHGDIDAWAEVQCEQIAADAAVLAEQIVAACRGLTVVGGR